MIKKSLILILGPSLVLFTLTACNSSAKEKASNEIYVSDCGYGKSQKPDLITLACADGGIYVDNLVWKSWSSAGAIGTGVFHSNTCDPDCSSGNFSNEPVAVTLSEVKTDQASQTSFFTKVSAKTEHGKVLISGKKYFETNLELPFVEEANNSDQSGEPSNQLEGYDSNLVINGEQDTCYVDMLGQPYCHVLVKISNIGNSPDPIYGVIQFQNDEDKWYQADEHPNGNLSPYIDQTLNPDMTLTIDVTIHSAHGSYFKNIKIFNGATEGSGDVVIGPIDLSIP